MLYEVITDHVELHSLKRRVPAPGYRQSFFQINRDYVHNILRVRSVKYTPYFASEAPWTTKNEPSR